MSSRPGSRRDHQRFCLIEGWSELRNARGGRTGHHLTFEIAVADGIILRTRISRPANAEVYGPRLWSHILDDQLCVDEVAFWACVDRRIPPPRTPSDVEPGRATLPVWLAHQLVHELGLTSEQVAGLDVEEATRLLDEHRSRPTA